MGIFLIMRTLLSMSTTVRVFPTGTPIRRRLIAEIICPDMCQRTWPWARRLARIFLFRWMLRIFPTRGDCWITALRLADFTTTIRVRFMGRCGIGFTFSGVADSNLRDALRQNAHKIVILRGCDFCRPLYFAARESAVVDGKCVPPP